MSERELWLEWVPQERRPRARDAFEAGDPVGFLEAAIPRLQADLFFNNIPRLRDRGIYEGALLHVFLTACRYAPDRVGDLTPLVRRADRDRMRAAGDPLPGPGPFTIFQSAASLGKLGLCWTGSEQRTRRLSTVERLAVWRGEVTAADVLAYVEATETFIVLEAVSNLREIE